MPSPMLVSESGKRSYYPGISEQIKSQTRTTMNVAPLSYRAHLSRPSTFVKHVDRQGSSARVFRRSIEGHQAGAAGLHYW